MRKILKKTAFFVLPGLWIPIVAMAGDISWQKVTEGIPETERINCVETDPERGVMYVGTDAGIYRKDGAGGEWNRAGLPGGKVDVKDMLALRNSVYAAGENGLYRGNEGKTWEYILGKRGLKGIAGSGGGGIIVWTEGSIYRVQGKTWVEIGPRVPGERIDYVAQKGGTIYMASSGNIYSTKDEGVNWGRSHLVADAEEGCPEETDDEGEEWSLPAIRKLNGSGDVLTISTGEGIFVPDDTGSGLRKIDTSGLPSSGVIDAVYSGNAVFAATGERVFMYLAERGTWMPVYEGAGDGKIHDLKVEGDNIFIISERGIYKKGLRGLVKAAEEGDPKPKRDTEKEPTILEVQKMAIEYAEVSPEKIKGWRQGARWRAILPRVSLGYSRGIDDNVEIYSSATKAYVINGPREVDDDWGVDLTWDLSELVWADAQTSIDVRSKLMVQLREDILEEVTRLYFERKRLLNEIRYSKIPGPEGQGGKSEIRVREKDGKELRIQELTAYIDALTGGEFSRSFE